MPIDQPPAIVVTLENDRSLSVELKGEQPVIVGDNNIMFPSHWTVLQCDGWLKEHPGYGARL